MERFNQHAGERDQGAAALVLDLAIAFERVSFPVAWATHFNFLGKILRVLCGCVEHQRRAQFEVWSWLLLRIVLKDALSEVTKIHPSHKLRVFVDDITAFMNGQNKRVGGDGRGGFAEVEERG